ncbi:hypothetical protein JB92DRAFT_3126640 [Gautieria morchelliformis]|nr:hypothetical protein JB92DRAFT_3126640 [Gautieria morchelliformis]
MHLSMVDLPDDILLIILEYFFIPLDPTARCATLSGRSSDSLGSLSLTCRRFAFLSRDILFRDVRLERRLCQQDWDILRSVGPHIKRLAFNVQLEGVSLAAILKLLIRLQSLFLMHGFNPELYSPRYGKLSTYLPVAHLSVDHGKSLSTLLGVFPALQTLQLSPCRYINPGWPVHPTLRRLKLLSLSTSFGPADTQVLACTFPGIKEFEARFERVRINHLISRWDHNNLRQWLAPILALPLSRVTLGYYSTDGYQHDLKVTSQMLAQRSATLESLTWRQHRFVKYTATKRIADLLVAENKCTWELWISEFEVTRNEEHTDVILVKEYQVC